MSTRRGFTLVELLVVVAIIGVLLAVMLPALGRAREQSMVVVVSAELRQVGVAIEMYQMDHGAYPPTREDCATGSLKEHLFQLPKELAKGKYLPVKNANEAMSCVMEDRFNPGRTYKYRSVGACVRDRDVVSKYIRSRLWVPRGFPLDGEGAEGAWYSEMSESPVKWVVFSVGPGFDEDEVMAEAGNRYPLVRSQWYDGGKGKGFIVRAHLGNGREEIN